MTDKLTRNAKQVLSLASDEATVAKLPGITPLNIVQGIARVPESTAFQALVVMGVEMDAFCAEVLAMAESNPLPKAGEQVIDRAAKEAKAMGDALVGSEHLLLAVASESLGDIGLLLAKYSIMPKLVAQAVASVKRPQPVAVGAGAPARPAGAGIAGAALRGAGASSRPNAGGAGTVVSATAAEPVGPYPHARRVGNLLFLSGVGPRKRGAKTIPGVTLDADGTVASYDFEAQVRACFENVRLVLEEAGSSWANIVDATVFLTDMKRDFPTMNRLWAEYFPKNQPTRTTVEVGALPTPIAFEVKIIATMV